MNEPEEVEFLRRAWQSLRAPDAHRELAEEEESTRAAVLWLRSAFHHATPSRALTPQVSAPKPLAPTSQSDSRSRTWALVVAASVLALFVRTIWSFQTTRTLDHLATPSALDSTTHPLEVARVPARLPVVEPTEGRIELRSGPVHLVFLSPRD